MTHRHTLDPKRQRHDRGPLIGLDDFCGRLKDYEAAADQESVDYMLEKFAFADGYAIPISSVVGAKYRAFSGHAMQRYSTEC